MNPDTPLRLASATIGGMITAAALARLAHHEWQITWAAYGFLIGIIVVLSDRNAWKP